MSDEQEFEETEHYVKIGKGKNAILVGKNQLLNLLQQGYTVHQALLKLAEQMQIFWIKGGDICKQMMINQFIYLYNLGIPPDKIIEHFQKEFPIELKCLIGEDIPPDEIQQNINEIKQRIISTISQENTPPLKPQPQIPQDEPKPPKPQPDEPDTDESISVSEQFDAQPTDFDLSKDDELELYAQEKAGFCCGINPRTLSLLTAVEHLSNQQTAEKFMIDYISNNWSESQLFNEIVKSFPEDKVVSLAFQNIPPSYVKTLIDFISKKESTQKAQQIYHDYLSGKIKSIIAFVRDNYPESDWINIQ